MRLWVTRYFPSATSPRLTGYGHQQDGPMALFLTKFYPSSVRSPKERSTMQIKVKIVTLVLFSFFTDSNEASIITDALAHMQKATRGCLQFVLRTNQPSRIQFYRDTVEFRCESHYGRIEEAQQPQKIWLSPSCTFFGLVVHEMMHALGFIHEHQRQDRDPFVHTILKNVAPRYQFAFEKMEIGNYNNTPYDYLSVTHYGAYSFSREPGLQTIEAVEKYRNMESVMGQTYGLSPSDVWKVLTFYGCPQW